MRNAVPVLRDARNQEQIEQRDLHLAKGHDFRAAAGSSAGNSAQLQVLTDEIVKKELARLMALQSDSDSNSESDLESERDANENCQRDYNRGSSCAAESQAS